jgi:hypothetical protein
VEKGTISSGPIPRISAHPMNHGPHPKISAHLVEIS